ncbi:hypothetical protein AA0118_g12005 [Alternaria tenuissima]|nr:hypothetical protein AA0118_g12005 [Alternaria tenuissima]
MSKTASGWKSLQVMAVPKGWTWVRRLTTEHMIADGHRVLWFISPTQPSNDNITTLWSNELSPLEFNRLARSHSRSPSRQLRSRPMINRGMLTLHGTMGMRKRHQSSNPPVFHGISPGKTGSRTHVTQPISTLFRGVFTPAQRCGQCCRCRVTCNRDALATHDAIQYHGESLVTEH